MFLIKSARKKLIMDANHIRTVEPTYQSGDEVFFISERRVETVVDNFGNPEFGEQGHMILSKAGKSPMRNFEAYDPQKHDCLEHFCFPTAQNYALAYYS